MNSVLISLSVAASLSPAEYVESLKDAPLLTLEEAKDLVAERNFDIRIAREQLARSALLAKKSYAATLPTINAAYNVVLNNQEIAFGDVVIQEIWQESASVTFDWKVLNGRSLPIVLSGYDAVEQSRLQFEQQKETLIYATSLAYYNSLTAVRTVEIRERALEIAQRNAELASARAELGSASSIDKLRADVAVATAEQDLVQAQIGKLLADRALAVLVNRIDARGEFEPFRVVRPDTAVSLDEGLLTRALAERLDLKIADLDLSIAERLTDESYGKFLPELVVNGGLFWNEAAGFAGNNTTWNIVFSAQWAIFEGGATLVELLERRHDIETATITLEQSKIRIADNVEQSRLNLRNARSNYEAARRRAELARQSAELAQVQFEVGAATQLEVLDANRSLADAESSEALGQLQVDLAQLELKRVVTIDPSSVASANPRPQQVSASDALLDNVTARDP